MGGKGKEGGERGGGIGGEGRRDRRGREKGWEGGKGRGYRRGREGVHNLTITTPPVIRWLVTGLQSESRSSFVTGTHRVHSLNFLPKLPKLFRIFTALVTDFTITGGELC